MASGWFSVALGRIDNNFVNFSISAKVEMIFEGLNKGECTSLLFRLSGKPWAKTRFFWITLVR